MFILSLSGDTCLHERIKLARVCVSTCSVPARVTERALRLCAARRIEKRAYPHYARWSRDYADQSESEFGAVPGAIFNMAALCLSRRRWNTVRRRNASYVSRRYYRFSLPLLLTLSLFSLLLPEFCPFLVTRRSAKGGPRRDRVKRLRLFQQGRRHLFLGIATASESNKIWRNLLILFFFFFFWFQGNDSFGGFLRIFFFRTISSFS